MREPNTSNDHLRGAVQTWNGVAFEIMMRSEAEELEKAGALQIATGLSASDLKPKDAFKYTPKADQVKKAKAKKAREAKIAKMKKAEYKTRQLTAE